MSGMPTIHCAHGSVPGAAMGRGLLLEHVFLEVMTVLMARDLSVVTRIGQIRLDAQEPDFVPCSDFFQRTMESFSTQAGTRLSFTDAAKPRRCAHVRRGNPEDRRSSCTSGVVAGPADGACK